MSYRISGHESFPCRYTWLPKAVRGLQANPKLFCDDERAMVDLGVGKNMVRSIRFGSQVSGMANPVPKGGGHAPAKLGAALLGERGLDPFLEDIRTLWLIHWNLSTNLENPLTARVHVNRVWEQLFGVGLVETLEDFGSQGDKPPYQELLDDLAARFQTDMKWSQKTLLRQIVLSRVYRQSSKASTALLERDPANRWLARGPRFRLTSEQLRDQALALGGILSQKMFGPPVMPYQPPGIWLTPYEARDWITSTNEDGHRRALYTFIRRSAAYPSFITFDSPNREFCTVRRIRSNTPLQALDLLNDPVFFEAAEGLAKRMAAEGGPKLESQLKRGIFLAMQRTPRKEEIAVLKNLYSRVDGNLTLVANAILNLDEVINKY